MDLKEQLSRIDRMREEALKFTAEMHKVTAEQLKLGTEQQELAAEAAKLARDRELSAWQLIFTGMGAGAALIGATAAATVAALRLIG